MKKSLLLLGFLSLSFLPRLQAQPYQSIFGTDSTKWVFRWANLNDVGDLHYEYRKDTLVNDTLYKKVEIGVMPIPELSALFREDTLNGKVWFRPLVPSGYLDTIEYLTFDFSLNVGDTFDIGNGAIRYATVDSIRYIDGLKYIYFDQPYSYTGDPGPWETPVVPTEPVALIEGIGSNIGPLWKSQQETLLDQYLMCSYKNGMQTSYKNIRYAGLCPQTGLGIGEETSTRTTPIVYPNPADKSITITHDQLILSASIYDMSGRKVSEMTDTYQTDVHLLSPGLYLIKITTQDNSTYSQKLIIHH